MLLFDREAIVYTSGMRGMAWMAGMAPCGCLDGSFVGRDK